MPCASTIAVALIAFLLLRLAQAAQSTVKSPLAFARLVRVNLMQRRRIDRLLQPEPHPRLQSRPTSAPMGLKLNRTPVGLTRASRECRDLLDCRVKPGNDRKERSEAHSSLNGPIISGSSLNQLPSWL